MLSGKAVVKVNKRQFGAESLRIDRPPSTLREIALDRVRRGIISGFFEPGERLVERSLCAQLGVSRSVVREVIRQLESERLIEMLPNQGPIVARLNWYDARQIYELRAMLEAQAVMKTARIADAGIKAALRRAFQELSEASNNNRPMDIIDATTRFYEIIFEASDSPIAWEIVSRLNSRISRLRVMTLSTAERTRTGPRQMHGILQAIEDNKPEAAATACRAHLAAASRIAERILNQDEAATGTDRGD